MATKMHSYTLSSVKGGTYELHQLHCTVIQHSTHYCALAGGGKGTYEPSQLTVAKSQTQHRAHPFNDDGDDDDGGGGDGGDDKRGEDDDSELSGREESRKLED